MPITESAKKALRNSRRKRGFNVARKEALSGAVKKFKKLISTGNVAEAKAFFSTLEQTLDKAAKTDLIKFGAASRKKSRFKLMLNKIAAK